MASSENKPRWFYALQLLVAIPVGLVVLLFILLFRQLCFACIALGFGLLGMGLFAADAAVWGQLGMWLLGIGVAGTYLRLAEIANTLKGYQIADTGESEENDEEEDEENNDADADDKIEKIKRAWRRRWR